MALPDPEPMSRASLTDDDIIRMTYEALIPPAEPTRSAPLPDIADIRRRVMQHDQHHRRTWHRRLAAAGVSLAVIIGVTFCFRFVDSRNMHQQSASSAVSAPVIALPDPADWTPARQPLTELAAQLPHNGDAEHDGRYTYTRTRSWSIETTVAAPEARITVRDEQRWWAKDQSGRQTVSTVTQWTPGTDPGPVLSPDPGDDTTYDIGQMPVVIPELADNVFALSSQLADQEDPANGPQSTLRAVREVYRFHDPSAQQRAALLQALADTDGLHSAGMINNGTGRNGLTIVVDSNAGATRDIAVFDTQDGRLQSYDTVLLRVPAGTQVDVPTLADSVLFIASGHTDDL